MQELAQDLALNDAVCDSLAVELRDMLVEPVMDWDRVGTEGRAQCAVVTPVVAQAVTVSGSVHGRWGGRGCGSCGEGLLASLTLVEGCLGCREKSVVTAGRDQGIVVAK